MRDAVASPFPKRNRAPKRLIRLAGLRDAAGDHSLNTTALVHEVYLRLVDASRVDLPDRARFLALASTVMRNLLVDRARARLAAKRGGGTIPLDLNEALLVWDETLERETELHEALTRLAAVSPRQSLLLQYCYFGGLSLEESASAVGVSLATAKRELRAALACLASQLTASTPRPALPDAPS